MFSVGFVREEEGAVGRDLGLQKLKVMKIEIGLVQNAIFVKFSQKIIGNLYEKTYKYILISKDFPKKITPKTTDFWGKTLLLSRKPLYL